MPREYQVYALRRNTGQWAPLGTREPGTFRQAKAHLDSHLARSCAEYLVNRSRTRALLLKKGRYSKYDILAIEIRHRTVSRWKPVTKFIEIK